MHIKRKFPNNQELSFSWKQAVELNIMLMDPFFNQQLTNREREIIYWAVLHTENGEAEGVELKQKILDSAKMSNMATLTEYFSKLRGKHCFIYNPKKRRWEINPIFRIPKDVTKFSLNIELNVRTDNKVVQENAE